MTNLPPVQLSEAAIDQIWRDLHKVVYARGEVAVGRNAYDDEAEAKAIIRKAFVTELQHSRAEEAVAWTDETEIKALAEHGHGLMNARRDEGAGFVIPLYTGPASPSATGVRVKPLVWSDESAPNDYCSYDHSFADTPFGRYQIEWKGWKDYPNFTIDFVGNLLDQYPGNTLEDARAAAQAHFDAAVLSAIAGQP